MSIARRDLLGLGTALALSLTTASCRVVERDRSGSSARTTPEPTGAPPATAAPTFAGRPGPGRLYYGASYPYGHSLPAWEKRLGARLSLHRSYFTPDPNETEQLVRQCRADLDRGRLPHVSTKPPTTWRALADGAADDWLSSILRPLGEQASPLFLTVHHEPENDAGGFGMQPEDYVAMQRQVIELAEGMAPQVTVVPVLQRWTFDPLRDDADPAAWIVPGAAVLGLDLYNPWSPENGRPWRSFGSLASEVQEWTGGTPLAIGEYGCRVDPSNPGLAGAWMRDAAEHARENGVVAMSYFNSDVGATDGPWTLHGETEEAFIELLGSDWVERST